MSLARFADQYRRSSISYGPELVAAALWQEAWALSAFRVRELWRIGITKSASSVLRLKTRNSTFRGARFPEVTFRQKPSQQR